MRQLSQVAIDAVVFDLDGVLLQSEEVWDAVRKRYVRERGGRYDPDIQRAMMGMNSIEWSRYLHQVAGVPDEPVVINGEVVRRLPRPDALLAHEDGVGTPAHKGVDPKRRIIQ
jgi:phosphoglycolate phosphatase-like HAD superfamily hydrolase